MSEDPIPYVLGKYSRPAGGESVAEAEVDHYRTKLRQLRVWLNSVTDIATSESIESIEKSIDLIDKLLARPRSNGEVIDRLEAELAELRAKLIDADVATMELRQHKQATRNLAAQVATLEKQVRSMTQNMGTAEWLLYRTAGKVAIRIDELLGRLGHG